MPHEEDGAGRSIWAATTPPESPDARSSPSALASATAVASQDAALPTLEALLTVPLPFIARHTHNKKEAEALLQVSLIAARLDSLLDCLRTVADQAARAHGHAARLHSLVPTDVRLNSLLPLLKELELQRRHDLAAYQEEVHECTVALERHKELLAWSACTHSSTAEQVGEMMPHLADAARRMAEVFNEVVARLDSLLGARESLFQSCRRPSHSTSSSLSPWISMAEFVKEKEGPETPSSSSSPSSSPSSSFSSSQAAGNGSTTSAANASSPTKMSSSKTTDGQGGGQGSPSTAPPVSAVTAATAITVAPDAAVTAAAASGVGAATATATAAVDDGGRHAGVRCMKSAEKEGEGIEESRAAGAGDEEGTKRSEVEGAPIAGEDEGKRGGGKDRVNSKRAKVDSGCKSSRSSSSSSDGGQAGVMVGTHQLQELLPQQQKQQQQQQRQRQHQQLQQQQGSTVQPDSLSNPSQHHSDGGGGVERGQRRQQADPQVVEEGEEEKEGFHIPHWATGAQDMGGTQLSEGHTVLSDNEWQLLDDEGEMEVEEEGGEDGGQLQLSKKEEDESMKAAVGEEEVAAVMYSSSTSATPATAIGKEPRDIDAAAAATTAAAAAAAPVVAAAAGAPTAVSTGTHNRAFLVPTPISHRGDGSQSHSQNENQSQQGQGKDGEGRRQQPHVQQIKRGDHSQGSGTPSQ